MLWKVLLTLGVIVAVWFGFRYAERLGAERERDRVGRKRRRRGGSGGGSEGPQQVEDLHQCSVCGDFVARDARPCGRDDCPLG